MKFGVDPIDYSDKKKTNPRSAGGEILWRA